MKKRADGRYQVQVELGTENGKRIRKTVYGNTQKEAKQNADALRLAFGRGIKASELTTPVSHWAELFLICEKRKTSNGNYSLKKYRLDRFCEWIGKDTLLLDIKPYAVYNFLISLADEHKSEKTIREYKNVISQLFVFAIRNEGASNNPCDKIELPKAEKKHPRRALTSEEQKRLAELPDSIYPGKAMALVCMWAGLRRGEATALTWNDINFTDNTIKVNKSWNYKDKSLKEPKTEAGTRLVPLLPCLAEYLKTLPKRSPYVFGKRLEQNDWEREMAHILKYLEKKYGNPKATPKRVGDKYAISLTIPYFTWHELRHTYCTILYDNDIPLKVAMLWMGHKSQEMTAQIYSHLSKEKEQAAKQSILAYGSQMVVSGSAFFVDT